MPNGKMTTVTPPPRLQLPQYPTAGMPAAKAPPPFSVRRQMGSKEWMEDLRNAIVLGSGEWFRDTSGLDWNARAAMLLRHFNPEMTDQELATIILTNDKYEVHRRIGEGLTRFFTPAERDATRLPMAFQQYHLVTTVLPEYLDTHPAAREWVGEQRARAAFLGPYEELWRNVAQGAVAIGGLVVAGLTAAALWYAAAAASAVAGAITAALPTVTIPGVLGTAPQVVQLSKVVATSTGLFTWVAGMRAAEKIVPGSTVLAPWTMMIPVAAWEALKGILLLKPPERIAQGIAAAFVGPFIAGVGMPIDEGEILRGLGIPDNEASRLILTVFGMMVAAHGARRVGETVAGYATRTLDYVRGIRERVAQIPEEYRPGAAQLLLAGLNELQTKLPVGLTIQRVGPTGKPQKWMSIDDFIGALEARARGEKPAPVAALEAAPTLGEVFYPERAVTPTPKAVTVQPRPPLTRPREVLPRERAMTPEELADARIRQRLAELPPESTEARAIREHLLGEVPAEVREESLVGKIFGNVVLGPMEALRTVKASFDLSAFRQGIFRAIAHPIKSGLKVWPMLRAFASEAKAEEMKQAIIDRPNYEFYRRGGLSLVTGEPYEVRPAWAWVKRIPGIKASQRAFDTLLNLMRVEMFDEAVARLPNPADPTNAELRALGTGINEMTGRGSLGPLDSEAARAFFWSPGLIASRFQLLVAHPLWGGTMPTRQYFTGEYARFLAGVAALYALGQAAGATIELDPRSADFAKLRWGNTRLDLLGGLIQTTVFASRMITGKAERREQTAVRFIRSKVSPGVGIIWELGTGKSWIGEHRTPTEILSPVPLAWQDIYDAMAEQGVPAGTALGILAIFGMGLQNYEARGQTPVQPIDPVQKEIERLRELAPKPTAEERAAQAAKKALVEKYLAELFTADYYAALSDAEKAAVVKEMRRRPDEPRAVVETVLSRARRVRAPQERYVPPERPRRLIGPAPDLPK